MLTLTCAQMKRAEALAANTGISEAQMMENAGSMAYQYLLSYYGDAARQSLILAGSGNNGGDGFVVARKMFESGAVPVVILCCGMPKTPLAKENYEALTSFGGCIIDGAKDTDLAHKYIETSPLLVDAVFGTGFHGSLEGTAADLISYANNANGVRISLDVPSGVFADLGETANVFFHPAETLAFASYKPLHVQPNAEYLCGKISVLDIGIPESALYAAYYNLSPLNRDRIVSALPVRKAESYKGNYGRLLVVCGSKQMNGAAMMSTLAAMRTGAGLTTLAAPVSVIRAAAGGLMEAMTLPLPETSDGALSSSGLPELSAALENADCCLIGCGLTVTSDTKQIVYSLIKNTNCQLVLDADALNCVSEQPEILYKAHKPPILTPHLGEMARLTKMTIPEIAKNTVGAARFLAAEKRAIVVLKGHRTVIASPEGRVFYNCTGNAGLAKGGSGDVLAGMISAFAAQGMKPEDAAACGVYIHGLCADRLLKTMSPYSMLARDVIGEIPAAILSLGR